MGRWVTARWAPSLSAPGGRRARQTFAFKAFVPDLLQDAELIFSAATAADLAEAEATLAVANHGAHLVAMETLSRLLLRSESVASSRIEGLECSQRRIAEAAFAPEHAGETARQVLANIDAMEQAIDLGTRDRELNVAGIQEMHWILMREDRAIAPHAGEFRQQQNWIGGRGDSPHGAAFVPPPPEHVETLMGDLASFANRDDLPVLAQAAIVHAQFETIHPFIDGNGRVGRCLIHTVLARRRLTGRLLAPISLILAAYGDTYVQGLIDFREGRVDQWCGTFASAAKLAMQSTARFETNLASMISRWRLESDARPDSYLWHACEQTTSHPVFTIASLRDLLDCSQNVAAEVVERLSAVGIVTQVSLGKRNRVFLNRAMLRLLDDFERDLLTNDAGDPGRVRVTSQAKTSIPPAMLPSVAHAVLELFPIGAQGAVSGRLIADITGYPAHQVREVLTGFAADDLVEQTQADGWSLLAKGRHLRAMIRAGDDLRLG